MTGSSEGRPAADRTTRASGTFAITTQRPVAIFMVVVAVAVFGYISYQQLALTLMPELSYPTVTIRTEYPDTAPEEVENLISRPIEQRLGVLNNLVSIVSISRAGVSDVILEFGWDTDMNDAVQTARENLDRLRLPEGVHRPLILRYDPTQDPIMRVGLYGGGDLYALRQIAEDEIRQELEALKGVAAARVQGGLEEEIRVDVDERQLALLGLGIADINRRLREENVNLAGGSLLDAQTQYLVRTLNEFQSLDEVAGLIVGEREGVEIRLKDVAEIGRGHKEREVITRVNGVESVEIEIFKEADANIVSTAKRVRSRLFGSPEQLDYVAKLKAGQIEKAEKGNRGAQVRQFVQLKEMTSFIQYSLPHGMEMGVLSDQSRFIERSVDEVKQTAVIGGLLAILVLYVFLRNPINTAIVGLAIPISVVATFAPMNIFDVSLNIMSLGGLALGIGMLVDNSIVVLESIFRCREEGDDIVSAAIRGTGEVGGAVFASTLTTVAVFFPIVFVDGVAGQVFGDMALTVVFSLIASLGVALFFIPMLASRRVQVGEGAGPGLPGGRVGEVTRSEVLQLWSLEKLKSIRTERARGGNLAPFSGWILLLFLCVILEFAGRTLWILAAAVILLLKMAFVVLAVVPYFPVAAGVQRLRNRGGPGPIWDRICSWGTDRDLFKRRFVRTVWDDLLSFTAPESLGRDFKPAFRWSAGSIRRVVSWALRGRTGMRLPRALPALLALVLLAALFVITPLYLFARFAIFLAVVSVGKVLVLALLLTALAGLAGLILLGLGVLPLLVPVLFLFEHGFGPLSRSYPTAIRWALQNRMPVILSSLALFVACWFLLLPRIGKELIPQVHQGVFDLEMAMPVGTPLRATDAMARRLETRVLSEGGVSRVASAVGVDRLAITSEDRGEHTAKMTVALEEAGDGDGNPAVRILRKLGALPVEIWGGVTGESLLAQREEALMARLRATLRDLPQLKIDFSRTALFTTKTPIEVEIRGYDLQSLGRLGREAEAALSQVPGLYDVKSSLQRGSPEVQIVYERDLLAEFGLNLRSVASLVREKIQGEVATRFREAERRIDMLVRLREADRAGVADLRRLVVNPEGEVPISLSAVADIRVEEGPSEIRRIDQQRAVRVSANVSGFDLGTVTGMIQHALEGMDVPKDVNILIGGQNREMQTSLNSLAFALALAIFLVYIVMASQFESFTHPLVIIFTIPLALIGVIVVLYLLGLSLSVVVFLGLIMLAGIVVNNAIVMVDYINRLRRDGMAKFDAIVRAATVRFRPIVMTTSTTVLGLLPMALGLGEGAEIRTPMAVTVVAGLISATVLTLVIVPTVYSLVDRGD